MSWTVDIVTQDGTKVVQNVDGVSVTSIRWALNEPTQCTLSIPILSTSLGPDDLVSDDGDTVNEVQVYRDGTLVGWFFPVGIDETPQTIDVTCADPLWLLSRRFVGELYEENLLNNGDFEGGTYTDGNNDVPDNWTNVGISTIDVGFSVNALEGDTICALEDGSATVNQYLHQDYTLPTLSQPTTYVASGYVWVEPLVPFVPTDYEHGVVIARYNSSNVIQDASWGRLNGSTDRFYWTRLAAAITVPANRTGDYLRVWLGCPAGKVYYDAVRLVEVKRLAFQGTDQASIAEELIEHSQDAGYGKADLDIATNCAATGIYRNRVYPFAEHEEILQALRDLAESADGFDYSMVCTPTTKTFTTHYPQKGTLTPVDTFRWQSGTTSNIKSWARSTSLSEASGSVSILGDGTTDSTGRADDREHWWAVDDTAHSGRRLEMLERAPSRANLAELTDHATEIRDALRSPYALELELHRTGTDNWAEQIVTGALEVGDVVTVVIDHGTVQVNGQYRIVELELDPRSEVVRPVVEPAREFES